jgi:hypothetical protein
MLPLILPLMCAVRRVRARHCARVCGCGFTLQTLHPRHGIPLCCGNASAGTICSCRLFLVFGFPFGVDATQLTICSADNHSSRTAPIHVLNILAMLRGERGVRRGVGGDSCLPLRPALPADVAQRLALACPAAIRDAG